MNGILELLMGMAQEPQLTHQNMRQHIMGNPEMRGQHVASVLNNRPPQQDQNLRQNQLMSEGVAVADPLLASALARLMGQGVPDQTWLNESHGLARKEQYRYR